MQAAWLWLLLAALAANAQELRRTKEEFEAVVRLPQQGLIAQTPAAIETAVSHRGQPVQANVRIDMPAMPAMPPVAARADGTYVFPHGGEYRLRLNTPEAEFEFPLTVKEAASGPTANAQLMLAAMSPGAGGGWYASGTSQIPRASPQMMLNWDTHGWNLMLHGVAMLTHTNQTGPRGRDKLFAPNWLMTMASHRAGPGIVTVRSMLTFEPLTITKQRYPLLFQNGETAYGIPIINGQHPHDFVMELAASYQIPLGKRTSLNFYGGPRGDPAMGPPAFPHRISASENPLAVISHHFQDSTHISANVVTGGITHGPVTWEVSGFHGREPDEKRWGVESGAIDSLSTRLTVNPTPRWSGQFSIGRINNREATHPLRDTLRTTASLLYSRRFAHGHWASSLMWGRNNDLEFTQQPGGPVFPIGFLRARRPLHIVTVPTRIPNQIYNSYLAESTLRFRSRNWIWGRFENTDKDSLLLFEEEPFVLLAEERRFARVQLTTVGYSRELVKGQSVSPSLGAQLTWFHAPPQLAPAVGANSFGVQIIFRLRLGAWFGD